MISVGNGVGHNSELTRDERKSLMFHHYRRVLEQKTIVDAAREAYKTLRREAKADGIALADLDFMLRCAEIDDPAIVPDELKRRAEIAAWFALPVDFQPDMFGSFDREPAEDRARREGKAAGASGKGSNPYDENSNNGKAWAAGWSEEQQKAQTALQSAMEKRNAAKAEAAEPDFPDDVGETDAKSEDKDWAAADPANQVPAE